MTQIRFGLHMAGLTALLLIAACQKAEPRYFTDFMEDRFAREGTLARCNANREATMNDLDCANARRAASAIALREEQERRRALEVESEAKIEALRNEVERERQRALAAQAAAESAEKAAYEALWSSQNPAEPAVEVEVDAPPTDASETAGPGTPLEIPE